MSTRLAVDIDGCVADFVAGFCAVANRRWPGIFPEDYVQRAWDFEDSTTSITKEQVNRVWHDIQHGEENFWLGLPPITDAVLELAAFLRRKPEAWEIFYVTSRVPTHGGTVAWQTALWLVAQGLWRVGDTVIVLPHPHQGRRKVDVYRALGISYSVDDYPANVPEDDELPGHQGYLLLKPWNEEYAKNNPVRVVKSLEEYFKAIEAQED